MKTEKNIQSQMLQYRRLNKNQKVQTVFKAFMKLLKIVTCVDIGGPKDNKGM